MSSVRIKKKNPLYDGILCLTLCVVSFFLPLIATSAPRLNHLKSLRVSVPDTVVQGCNFYVEYALEATHWKNAHVTKGVGLTLTDNIIPITLNGNPYHRLYVKARFTTSRVGRIKLPPMVAEIDGIEVMSEIKEVYVKPHSSVWRRNDCST